MNNLNTIIVEGNLVRDPEIKIIPSGAVCCSFAIANNRTYLQEEKRKEEVSYIDIETWAKLGERCGKNLDKGRAVRVVGRLKQDRWKDKDGLGRSKMKIVAEHVEFSMAKKGTQTKESSQAGEEEISF